MALFRSFVSKALLMLIDSCLMKNVNTGIIDYFSPGTSRLRAI